MHLIRESEREIPKKGKKKRSGPCFLSPPPEEKTKRLQQKQIHYCSREESVTTYAAVEPKTRKTKKKKRKKKQKQKNPPVYRAYRVSTCNVKPGYERRHTSDASPQMAVFQTTVQGCSLRLNMGKGKWSDATLETIKSMLLFTGLLTERNHSQCVCGLSCAAAAPQTSPSQMSMVQNNLPKCPPVRSPPHSPPPVQFATARWAYAKKEPFRLQAPKLFSLRVSRCRNMSVAHLYTFLHPCRKCWNLPRPGVTWLFPWKENRSHFVRPSVRSFVRSPLPARPLHRTSIYREKLSVAVFRAEKRISHPLDNIDH